MARIRAGLLLTLVGAALCCAGGCAGTDGGAVVRLADYEQPEADMTHYRLEIGDVVKVVFQGDRTLDYEAPVSPAGTIGLPSGDEVVARGRTVEEVRDEVEEAMKAMLVDPRAAIVLVRVGEQPVYVLGEVERPGMVESSGTMTVSMALAQAGGLLSTGKTSSVMVVRTTGVPEPVSIQVDVTKVLSGRDLSHDLSLRPYDVVFVPKSVIGKVDEFVDVFFHQIAPAQLFYLRGYDIAKRRPLNLNQ